MTGSRGEHPGGHLTAGNFSRVFRGGGLRVCANPTCAGRKSMASFKSLLTPLLKATKPVGRDPKRRRNITEGETKKFGIVSRHFT